MSEPTSVTPASVTPVGVTNSEQRKAPAAATRYYTRLGPLECFSVEREGVAPMSTIVVVDSNLEPLAFAFHLLDAANWFRDVSRGKVEAAPPRRLKPLGSPSAEPHES